MRHPGNYVVIKTERSLRFQLEMVTCKILNSLPPMDTRNLQLQTEQISSEKTLKAGWATPIRWVNKKLKHIKAGRRGWDTTSPQTSPPHTPPLPQFLPEEPSLPTPHWAPPLLRPSPYRRAPQTSRTFENEQGSSPGDPKGSSKTEKGS